jgi:hypothetical protein
MRDDTPASAKIGRAVAAAIARGWLQQRHHYA